MRFEKSQKSVFSACCEEGAILPVAKIECEQIKDMISVALIDLDSVNEWKKSATKNSGRWNAIYKLTYDVLHTFAEAFLLLDKIKAKTHECLFAHLCEKHSELDFDWNFFEKIRTKRNGINYYGRPATYQDFKEIEVQAQLYIRTLNKSINEKLKKIVSENY